jgi:hypothetical protein
VHACIWRSSTYYTANLASTYQHIRSLETSLSDEKTRPRRGKHVIAISSPLQSLGLMYQFPSFHHSETFRSPRLQRQCQLYAISRLFPNEPQRETEQSQNLKREMQCRLHTYHGGGIQRAEKSRRIQKSKSKMGVAGKAANCDTVVGPRDRDRNLGRRGGVGNGGLDILLWAWWRWGNGVGMFKSL